MKKQESYRRFTTEEIMQCKTNPQMLNELVKNCQGLVYKIARSITMDFTYEPEETGELRLYLRAVSTEGYRFEFDLLHANLIEEDPDNEESKLVLDETSVDYSVSYVVYDKRGGKLVLE